MTAENFIKAQLAALAYREAAYLGGLNNMLAIALVIRNRVNARIHGGDWLKVIATSDEMSAHPPESIKAPDMRDPIFRLLLQKIDDVFTGVEPDKFTEGALFYCELHLISRPWFQETIVRDPANHPRVANVASVVFFR